MFFRFHEMVGTLCRSAHSEQGITGPNWGSILAPMINFRPLTISATIIPVKPDNRQKRQIDCRSTNQVYLGEQPLMAGRQDLFIN